MSKPHAKPPRDFEQAMTELERLVHEMETGKITLEESLSRFERGTFLIDHCRKMLNSAEQRIQELTRAADGTLRLSTQPDQSNPTDDEPGEIGDSEVDEEDDDRP